MKQPKMGNVKFDKKVTDKMRKEMQQADKVKVTINFDSEVLSVVRSLAEEKGVPYQRFLNQLVKEAVENKRTEPPRPT